MNKATAAVILTSSIAVPFLLPGDFYLGIATQVLLYGLFATSVNVLAGYGGMVSLGHAGLLGVSAYVYAVLVTGFGFGPFAAAFVAVAIGLGFSAVLGVIALRTTGISFLMITLALGQIVWGVAFRYTALTNGDNGINVPREALFFESPVALYYLCLGTLVFCITALAVLMASPLGASIKGVRDQSRRMRTLGYNPWVIRVITFMISGLIASISGVLYLQIFQFISPHALSLTVSSEAVLMVISGGIGTLAGPVAGAGVVVLLKNVASAYTDRWVTLLGLIFLLIVIALPDGLVPGVRRLVTSITSRASASSLRQRPSELGKVRP
ncbi:branched-chain amino acid ABC transporter permease [Rhizobium mesoamericanum]|uniref:branched-chain amino acid ABC transporter permease n=1 Tax=Rhizobium mesoamericanum TaxID=1079800 RepID=UPI000424A62E|nr:branched-chain amino acid ABC transporter permease [Rhizobium mesoamericanum]